MKIFERTWEIISEPSNKTSQVALAIAIIVVASIAGTLCAFLFGFTSRPSGFGTSLAGGLVAVLSCLGAFSAGGMLGLLFGSPTWGSTVSRTRAARGTDKSETGSSHPVGIRPNTSLERIADWLTTMIVGLSLVHLNTIEERATTLSIWVTRAITADTTAVNGTVGIVIIGSYAFAGFFLVYLWAMRFLPSELRSSYEDLEGKIEHLTRYFKSQPIFGVPRHALDTASKKLQDAGVDDECRTDIVKRYASVSTADDEPMLNFGPTEGSGYRLSAVVSSASEEQYKIDIRIDAPADSEASEVLWLLHNTFAPDVVSACPLIDGVAKYETVANEAFWLGAVIPQPGGQSIRLAIDLRTADGATDQFRGTTLVKGEEDGERKKSG